MNGKGMKRPLIRTAVSTSTGTGASQPQPQPQPRGGIASKEETPRNWTKPRNPQTPPGRPYCCGCRPWNGSKLRLASIVGIHVLGLMACPCRGFSPPSTGAGPGLIGDGQRNADFECRSSAVDSDGSGDFRWWAESCGDGERGRGGRRRPRDSAVGRGGFAPDVGVSTTSCPATRLPSAEEGRPLGLLYDAALLKTSTPRNGGGGGVGADAGGKEQAAVSSVVTSGEGEASVETGLFERMSPAEGGSGDNTFTAQWASVVNGATMADAAAATTTTTTMTPLELQRQQQQQQQQQQQDALTLEKNERPKAQAAPVVRKKWSGKGWLGIGASWRAGEGWSGRGKDPEPISSMKADLETSSPTSTSTSTSTSTVQNTVEETCLEDDVFAAVEVGRRRYGGDDTAVAQLPRNSTDTDIQAGVGSVEKTAAVVVPPNATDVVPIATDMQEDLDLGPEETSEEIVGVLSTLDLADRPNWRVWRRPGAERAQGSVEEELCATAREQLTLYLLETGATHYDVATAAAALFAVEPESALAEVTWRRWRQNLDGLRSTGFTGSDVAHMLALCPQLLALDYEGQVVPAMELLRKRLGMRPTDVRRVIKKAPEVLAPRADGTTAAEAVDVLRALGLQTRHLRLEALRWPQLLAVPPANFFQLAAFLASEEVGIKATNIGSLIRQAPWLVLQRIDGQMLPVARFLRQAGVMDMERVVRAYPRILCASIRGELAPRVRFLWKDVGVSEEDLPRVLQTFPLLFAVPLPRMEDVVKFLSEDLTINGKDIAKIIRAFPSLLGLERERHMSGVVLYLKKLGVQNVGRFVSRLPPVLGYDVNTNLAPKMDYLVEEMGLSVYDVLTFPAYFSYPLDTVIEPRTEFLIIRGRPITLVGLNIALQQGDADFARKVAKVQPIVYQDFKRAYLANREAVRSGESDAESVLSEPQRKAIGNLGGQSTSNNVSEVTARATGLPPKNPKEVHPQPPPSTK